MVLVVAGRRLEHMWSQNLEDVGPVQLLAVKFGPEADYKGRILKELDNLEGSGQVRVLDILFAGHDSQSGDILAFDYHGKQVGDLVSVLMGFALTNAEYAPEIVHTIGESVGHTRTTLDGLLKKVKPDEAVGLVLIEHLWARDLKRAIHDAGGTPLAEGFLTSEMRAAIGSYLEATVRILEDIKEGSRFRGPTPGPSAWDTN